MNRECIDIPVFEASDYYTSSKPYEWLSQFENDKGERIMAQMLDGQKHYLMVSLCKNGTVKRYLVHRLVAQAFVENPYNFPEVNHKDENKTNNHFENLEWCTHKYNSIYGTRKAASRGERNAANKFSEQTVRHGL